MYKDAASSLLAVEGQSDFKYRAQKFLCRFYIFGVSPISHSDAGAIIFAKRFVEQERIMLFRPDRARRLDCIANMLRESNPSAELITLIVDVCERALSSQESQHIKELVQAGAWTEAAFALLGIELPSWKLRRLTYDEGEWHCAISRQRELPEWLDTAIETRHPSLPMAVLKSVVEGLGVTQPEQPGARRPRQRPDRGILICCDNFR